MAPLVDLSCGKPRASPTSAGGGSIHSAMKLGNTSCTGASLKVVPPGEIVISIAHVPTDRLITESLEPSPGGGVLHDPDIQCASSNSLTAVVQSEALIEPGII
jgi:hypothetical protein